jgi:hypothetical protein
MNDGSDLWMNLYGEISATSLHSPTQQGDAAERKQGGPPPLETFCPLRTAWTQPDLRVEKLNVRLVKTVLLQRRNITCVLAQGRRQIRPRANRLDE